MTLFLFAMLRISLRGGQKSIETKNEKPGFYFKAKVGMKYWIGSSVKKVLARLDNAQKADAEEKFKMLQESLKLNGIEFKWQFSPVIHDREVKLDNGWIIKIGCGLDIYQRPENWYSIGSNDFDLRPCLETTVDVFRS